MGPTILFDKSFLQSLTVEESVMFDHFFIPTICPVFYIETLADLEKAVKEGRTPEHEVGAVACKTPEMNGNPCAHHAKMCLRELLGRKIAMTGQIPVDGGRAVNVAGRRGVVFEQPPEAEAFQRWQAGDFLDVERRFARIWRNRLNAVNLQALADRMKAMGVNPQTCKSLEDAKRLADNFIRSRADSLGKLHLLMMILGLPPEYERVLALRWELYAYTPLAEYAPFCAHVLSVELFFQMALAANLIGTSRVSNRTDIAYLFYLPFCMVFVSSDKLHRRTAPQFHRPDQSFVWGEDLKRDLLTLVIQYDALPEEERERGIIGFRSPLADKHCLVAKLWDHHFGLLRRQEAEEAAKVFRTDRHTEPEAMQPKDRYAPLPTDEKELLKRLNEFSNAPGIPHDQVDFDTANPEMLSVHRMVHHKKGSIWQLPKRLAKAEEGLREQA